MWDHLSFIWAVEDLLKAITGGMQSNSIFFLSDMYAACYSI